MAKVIDVLGYDGAEFFLLKPNSSHSTMGRDWSYLHVCKQPCLQVNNNKCLRQYIMMGGIKLISTVVCSFRFCCGIDRFHGHVDEVAKLPADL